MKIHTSVLYICRVNLSPGEEDQEGWCSGQVRDSLWLLVEKDGEKDRNLAARKVRVLLLWEGECGPTNLAKVCTYWNTHFSELHEEEVCGYMAL